MIHMQSIGWMIDSLFNDEAMGSQVPAHNKHG